MQPTLTASLGTHSSQHGFKPRHSTLTGLLPLTTLIAEGFNHPKPAARTGLLSIDLSKAFDVIVPAKLLQKINATDLNPNLKRWLSAYLRDRRARVSYQGVDSRWRKCRLGVPQG